MAQMSWQVLFSVYVLFLQLAGGGMVIEDLSHPLPSNLCGRSHVNLSHSEVSHSAEASL